MLSPKNAAKILFVVFLGILAMHLRLRLSLVDPTNFEWLWNGDWANAASGFLFFVEDAWRWPVGKMENLLAPLGTSIGFTDSIPLAAFFFKAIRELLPFPFHYLGLWFLLCFILQALFSFLIFEELKLKTWIAFGGAFLVALAPPLLYRIGHISLCSHFFILWQILMYFKFRHQNHPKFLLGAGAGVLLATGIHPYIWAMVFLMSLALELEMLRGKRVKRSIFLATASLGLKFSSSFAALKAVGYFLPADKDHGGFSFYKGDLTVF